MRSKKFDKKLQAAELQAATANSGMNVENAMRQRVKDILKSDKLSAGFTHAELKEMHLFATGKRNSANVRRYIGNLLGGGGGLGQAVVAGGTAALAGGAGVGLAGPAGLAVGAVPAAIGWGLKTSSNRAARRGMGEIDEMIRKRSPLYKQRAADAPAAPLSAEARAAAVRAMMTGDPLQIYLSASDPR
jgi:arsenate reductase-like glutaredoxin family protein